MSSEPILVERRGAVAVVTLNRPEARNALSSALMKALGAALMELEDDEAVGAIVLTGGDRMFSAGADIKEMTAKTFAQAYLEDFVTRDWDVIPKCRKPILAAVAGHAVGGGCEVALMCDIVVADETARFGQPEVRVGTIPGGGGTQRLARILGKSKTMELCLSGRLIDAYEAERIGIVARLAPPGQAITAAVQLAEDIASYSRPVVMMIKESVNRAFETSLAEGLRFERRMLHATFALEDQTEAMTAFAERRAPVFRNR
ncbi:enoyl-CoA hydratase-related protein [Phenylobacterium sp. J367]|uniref:enoyl-CoA hydratase-related protein n=1 Tax=Phenylobacterium sp. J367 TaxID=2898435 RepID=UPI0021509D80|nr:enoyl-CoA hydratase-related protein [Phenylobacterium sp. J367]MCR5879632.1 enoyl-CoA hydratase-related protein [Phenylobacterium sp. J367]